MVVTARPLDLRDGQDARTVRLAVEVDGAGAALRHAAPVLGPGQAEQVAQDPEERHVRRRRDVVEPCR